METSQGKFLSLLAVQSKSSAHRAPWLLKPYSYKSGAVQMLFLLDWEARRWYCRWAVANWLLDPELMLFSGKTWFTLMGMRAPRITYISVVQIPMHSMKCPLCNHKVGFWCALSAHRITEPMFLREVANYRLQPLASADLNPCHCSVLRTLQDTVYVNNPKFLQAWKARIWKEIADNLRWALSCIEKYFYNVQHMHRSQRLALFETLLWNWVNWTVG